MPKGLRNRVWRFQRSRWYGDVVSAMTHDRALSLSFPVDQQWHELFAGRLTFYAVAFITSANGQPRLGILRETTKEDWK